MTVEEDLLMAGCLTRDKEEQGLIWCQPVAFQNKCLDPGFPF